MHPRQRRVHLGVAEGARSGEPAALTVARRDDAFSPGPGTLPPGGFRYELERLSRLELADDVDPVDQRPAEAAPVAHERGVLALAVAPRPRAGTRVAGADQHDRGGEADRLL